MEFPALIKSDLIGEIELKMAMSKRIDKRCYADLLFGREANKFLWYLYFFMFAVFCSYSPLR